MRGAERISIAGGLRPTAEETARIATDAMLDIATAMEKFAERWVPPGSSMRNGLTADLMIKRTR